MKNLSLLFSIITFLILNSCGIYVPTTVNTPLLKEKGQTAISATFGSGFNGQFAKAIGNHYAILANSSFYSIENPGLVKRPYIQPHGFGYFNEIGGGYFTNHRKATYYEIFVGIGRNRVTTTVLTLDKPNNEYLNLKYNLKGNKIFLQPSLGWQGKNIEFIISSRIGLLKYNVKMNELPDSVYKIDKLRNIDKNIFPVFEPAITLRSGGEKLKVQLQFGASIDLGRNQFTENSRANLSIGLFSKFPYKKKL
jgi:hypothetical protein